MGRGVGCAVDSNDGGDGRVVGVDCCGRGSNEVMMVMSGSGDDVDVGYSGVEVVVADGGDDGGDEWRLCRREGGRMMDKLPYGGQRAYAAVVVVAWCDDD
ncbi:hypothetical protein Tco_0462947 [Tanacetum coccineum]